MVNFDRPLALALRQPQLRAGETCHRIWSSLTSVPATLTGYSPKAAPANVRNREWNAMSVVPAQSRRRCP